MADNNKPEGEKSKQNSICFVIMPFGGYFDSYYRDIYKPAIQAAGFEPKRADDLYRSSAIVKDIWEFTKAAKVLLADLSDRNPNVFYELGLAHAIKQPVILVTQSINDIPFDLRGLRVIEYDKNVSNWGEILKTNISKAIKETIASPKKSIVAAFLDESDLEIQSVTQDDKRILELEQDIQMLKRQINTEINIKKNPNWLNPYRNLGLSRPANLTEAERALSEPYSLGLVKNNKEDSDS